AAAIAGYYTLTTGQLDFGDLPPDLAKGRPRRLLPVVVLAWFGVGLSRQGQGLGRSLRAPALSDCHHAGKTLALIAVIVDCLSETAKAFFQRWDFRELPGHPYRLVLSARQLEAMMTGS